MTGRKDASLESGCSEPKAPAYQPPEIVSLGNIKDLVLGGQGSVDEVGPPFLSKRGGQPG